MDCKLFLSLKFANVDRKVATAYLTIHSVSLDHQLISSTCCSIKYFTSENQNTRKSLYWWKEFIISFGIVFHFTQYLFWFTFTDRLGKMFYNLMTRTYLQTRKYDVMKLLMFTIVWRDPQVMSGIYLVLDLLDLILLNTFHFYFCKWQEFSIYCKIFFQ